jgi:sulfur dioxygenase
MIEDFMFHTIQLFEPESSTFSYLLVDQKTNEALLIDPVRETQDRDIELINKLGVDVVWIVETHIHADHLTSAGYLAPKLSARIALSARAGISKIDKALSEGDQLKFGESSLRVLETPGHTNTCLSFYGQDQVFTGDALLIGGNGRTDFQQGDAITLFRSIRQKLFTLPDETTVYPAHNYFGIHSSTIAWEKKTNPRVKEDITEEQFISIMKDLNLPYPKKIDIAVPGNLKLGLIE